jgi:hypothetical protein
LLGRRFKEGNVKSRVLALLGLLSIVVLATSAWAITYGELDGDAHPSVGLIIFFTDDPNAPDGLQPLWRCSGTLIDADLVLTAAHCTEAPATRARVWFDGDLSWLADELNSGTPWSDSSLGGHWGTPIPHPNWRGTANFTGGNGRLGQTWDIGAVCLDEPVPTSEVDSDDYGVMAAVGTLNQLATQGKGADFDIVGYGLQGIRPEFVNVPYRYRGQVSAVNLRSQVTGDGTSIQISAGPGKGIGPGGACFGDSGGPLFLRGTNTIVGISSFVLNQNCKGTGFYYRADMQSSHGFIDSLSCD